MITKVTSANYDNYTLLFNQADAALKKANGEPTEDFLEIKPPIGEPGDDSYEPGDEFDNTVQYFDEFFVPCSFENPAAFNARDLTKKWYKLNESFIYDLDTYFSKLRVLADIDYSFLRLPIDEPTFNIVDGGSNGRRVIEVPDAFKSGISVQGDETAEILFFCIDRYYDATDLWSDNMNFIIQWKTATKNGVTKAFINKDGRPFLDNGKLYFGWPISSEITKEAGNVTFSVRIFRFSGGVDENYKPKLAFGLNTQTATTRINESISFEFKDDVQENNVEFEDAENINKTSEIISRVFNSTIMSETKQEAAPTPILIQNILPYTEAQLAQMAKSVITKTEDIYTLATDEFDENETYYNGSQSHDIVDGLNANIYRKGFYYLKETKTQKYYEFDYEDIIEDIQQILAIAPTGMITYSGMSSAEPGSKTVGGRMELIVDDNEIFKPVKSERAELNHKYYEKDDFTGKYSIAQNVVTKPGEEWTTDDRNMNMEGHPCKYFERYSPILKIIDEPSSAPIGCYWLVAYNNESKKAMSKVESYKIWIPGPVDLIDSENINDEGKEFNDEEMIRILLDENHNAHLDINVVNVKDTDTIKYKWYKKLNDRFIFQEDLESSNIQDIAYSVSEDELPLVNDEYMVECYSVRNKKVSDTSLSRKFRVTDIAHKFIFDTVPDSPDEEAHRVDSNVKVIYTMSDEPNANIFKIDFSENLDENDNLKILSDKIAFRFRKRQVSGADIDQNIYLNDMPADGANEEFEFTTFEELKDMNFEMRAFGQSNYYYVEMINIVNEDFDLDALNTAARAVNEEYSLATTEAWAPYEARISRTPYRCVLE